MVIKPKVRGFVCVTTHPEGCSRNVQEQIKYIRNQEPISHGPKKVLVIGASTGYGLASRITAAFGTKADTLGVFFERPASQGRPASPGWYNSIAFEEATIDTGLYAKSINGDAYSQEIKDRVINTLKDEMGPVDLVVYSLASPRRTDPTTGIIYKSCIKPMGQPFTGKTLDTDKKMVKQITIKPASQEEIEATTKVMGGEDWELWMQALQNENLLAPAATSVAYSYLGPEATWPIYKHGTIGKAKEHLELSASKINELLQTQGGRAFISINKALVTQASSAIPVVPLYISLLYKVMKKMDIHEGCIEQMYRLFATRLYNNSDPKLDQEGRIRIDDWEMRQEVQEAVKELWPRIDTDSLDSLSDFAGYQADFLKLFGFGLPEIDYDQEVEIDRHFPSLANT